MISDIENRYAIVGIGGIFPDAPELASFWRNIRDKRVSIGRLPEDSEERRVYFRPEVLKKTNKEDKSYTDILAAIDGIEFDSERFRIPPSVAKHMDENQKVALLITEQAMAGRSLDKVAKERIGIVMGNSGYGELHHDFHRRFIFDLIAHTLENQSFVDQFIPSGPQRKLFIEQLREQVLAGTFGLTEDSAPGMLPSIIASRIASVFDLHGQSMVVDTACASALAAVSCGIQQLKLHQSDAVICGGVDMPVHAIGRLYFSAIGALSPDGSFPFDARANGFIIGQGGGVVILKRLRDAIDCGDTINAVITGIGVCTDGKGKAIAAPNEVWQAQAIRSAYEKIGYPVDTVELIEAHGTSTQVGDKSEVNALKRAFKALGCSRTGFCGIGSVKSNIGHLKSAAGIAGLLKATLALENKWLPPSAGFERLSPALNLDDSPFFVLAEGKAWNQSATPRRAGVSSFGFGGVNYHVALEEYCPEMHSPRPQIFASPNTHRIPDTAPTSDTSSMSEVAFFAGANTEQLIQQVADIHRTLKNGDVNISEMLAGLNGRTDRSRGQRLAFTVHSRADLVAKIELVLGCEAVPEALDRLKSAGIHFSAQPPVNSAQVAVLFPGQGSQYPGMLGYVRRRFVTAHTLETRANRLWQEMAGSSVTALIDPADGNIEAAVSRLRETNNTHPAILTVSLAAYTVLEQMGLRPAFTFGHSLGEYSAQVAAGRLTLGEGLMLMRCRGTALSQACAGDGGAMIALPLDETATTALITESKLPLTIANLNSPRQTIVSGDKNSVEALLQFASSRGHRAVRLNVSRAFHSPLMKDAQTAFEADLRNANFRPGATRVLSGTDAQVFGDTAEAVHSVLSRQITSPVNFIAGIERLYAEGIKTFVEIGPSSVLSALTREILGERPGLVLSCDDRKADSDEAFLRLLCGLHVAGLHIDPSAAATTVNKGVPQANENFQTPITTAPKNEQARPADQHEVRRIVYSGVSVGLPGSYKDAFRDDNFQQLFEGRNMIERLTDTERRALVDLHISKVVKSEQGSSIVELQTLDEVIQLVGKLGKLNLTADYHVDDKELQTMSGCVAHAVAAGYEALRDARIPLVLEYNRTSSGRLLPDRWALPREMQATTGIIFANGFPLIDQIITEVSRHLSLTLGNRTGTALFEFYDGLISRVSHAESRKMLTDWFALNYSRLCPSPNQDQVYQFNHQLMTQITMQANNRLAKRINARGPNFLINAACSSTPTAIMLAQDLIQSGRVERMIIIGADDSTSSSSLPYLGAGFLSTGACSNNGDLYEAAVPFDKRRDGMIMSSGAVGIVVESNSECERRGVIPVCELLGTHMFNSAGHSSQLDQARYAAELETFIALMEQRHGISRTGMAPELVYFSHEPFTPARGGCSETEATSLRHVFGAQVGQVEVSNTKGMTGHTMGASVEDVTAAKALQFGQVPPVVNHRVADPTLADLKLSRGGSRRFQYALRMAAGMGSQGNYVLLKRVADGEMRIANQTSYQSWLQTISLQTRPEVIELGRILVVKDTNPGAVLSERPRVDCAAPKTAEQKIASPVSVDKRVEVSPAPVSTGTSPDKNQVQERVLDTIAHITGYKRSLLDPDMELEADLGVDTVKQATVLATLAETFKVTDIENIHMSDYPTVRALIDLFTTRGERSVVNALKTLSSVSNRQDEFSPQLTAQSQPVSAGGKEAVAAIVLEIVAGVTGYRLELIEPGMELEADLGVDTVKQATILAHLAERFNVADDPSSFRISEFPTVGHLADFFANTVATTVTASAPALKESQSRGAANSPDTVDKIHVYENSPQPHLEELQQQDECAQPKESEDIQARIIKLLTECTPYPAEMLEPDLTLDSDLGLNADARERLRNACVAAFNLDTNWQLPFDARIADLPALLTKSPRSEAAQSDSGTVGIARQILALRLAPLNGKPESLKEKSIWILGDDQACVQSLQASLASNVRDVRIFVFPQSGSPEETVMAANRDLDGVAPDILIDTTACGTGFIFESSEPQAFEQALMQAADCRFALWKSLYSRKLIPGRTIVVTMMDGAHGLDDKDELQNPLFGLCSGFYKALRKQETDRQVVILDLAPSALDFKEVSSWELVLAELAGRGPGVEVCYRSGVRHRMVLMDSPRFEVTPGRQITKDDVMVVTGGGAGITAAIIKQLVLVAPCNVALVGRTALSPETRKFNTLTQQQREGEKEAIREHLSLAGKRVTPVMVDKAYAALERAAEIHDTIAALEASGARVSYHEADVCDCARMESVLDEIRRVHGPITTIIHGAGIEVSHTLDKKTLEEFQSVHRIKTLGAWNLSWLCRRDPLRRVVAISSISGRLGSQAQIDYSSANAFLDSWARMYQRRSGTSGLSLIWSAWSHHGMAWRNTFVRENADRSGIGFIDPAIGAKAAVAEIAAESADVEVLFHRGLGDLLDKDLTETDPASYPFIDWVEHGANGSIAFWRNFSPRRDAILDQHRLVRTSLMPGVGLMEIMAESHGLASGRRDGALVYRQLEFVDALKFYRDTGRDVQVRITTPGREPDQPLGMEVWSMFRSPQGDIVEDRLYASANVCRETINPPIDSPANWNHGKVTDRMSFARALEVAASLRQGVNLGPLLNESSRPEHDTARNVVVVSEEGIVTHIELPKAQLSEPRYPLARLHINPAFLDSMHQAAAIFSILKTGAVYLPVGAETFTIFEAPNKDTSYDVIARVCDRSSDRIRFDIALIRDGGRLCCLAEKVVLRKTGQ